MEDNSVEIEDQIQKHHHLGDEEQLLDGRFYNTFKPFLAKTKNKAGDSRINIKVNNTMVVFALGC